MKRTSVYLPSGSIKYHSWIHKSLMESFASDSLGSIETISGGDSFCRILSDNTGSETSSNSCHAGIL